MRSNIPRNWLLGAALGAGGVACHRQGPPLRDHEPSTREIGGSRDTIARLGYCYHTFRDPVIRLESAIDSRTKRRVPRLTLDQFSLNGAAIPMPARLTRDPFAYNATVDGARVICRLPCGFGFEEGLYRFQARAQGYRAQIVETEARYKRNLGSCPSTSEGSSVVAVILDPE